MNKNVLLAVFKRNLISYFSSPLGYVFICVFVLLSSVAAFCSPEFFNANLANLDQLNYWLPAIMLVFIPAITMSIWADERRLGTDELLLTIPATDQDIVVGKYLAALAIFAISLVFSFVSNLIVLRALGNPDFGLFLSTYIGYFMVGMAMLAVGMVASFLTFNLTVGFILGAMLNIPLVVIQYADVVIPRSDVALKLKTWSIGENFSDFGRGVLSLSSLIFFLMIVVVMIYLSMVLIGRRHWQGGRDGHPMLGHFLIRSLALAGIAAGSMYFIRNHDFLRIDLTSSRINSLSPDTKKILRELKPQRTVHIEAFLSPSVPEAYVETRQDLISMLHEIDQQGGDEIVVQIYDAVPFSDTARRAEEEFGITRKTVRSKSRGNWIESEILLGAVFRSGLDKVVVPFFELGIPVEYELVRSISTVIQPSRKRLGVVTTDAALFGSFGSPPQMIIDELKKQYEVEQVNPSSKIVDPQDPSLKEYDVLLAVQPSSLTPAQLPNLLDAIKAGVPTAIFEDPFPAWMRGAPGTSQPKQPPMMGMNMFQQQQQRPQPKCNIDDLWNLLDTKMEGAPKFAGGPFGGGAFDASIIWQAFNPYPKLRQQLSITNEWVFANIDAPGAKDSFNADDPITSGIKEILFLLPGAISQKPGGALKFTNLITTGNRTGTVTFDDLRQNVQDAYELRSKEKRTDKEYTLAARITGKLPAAKMTPPQFEQKKSSQHTPGDIDVVIVMDIDLLDSTFLRLRAEPMPELDLHFQNVPFALNVLDALAGDDRFINIRKREQQYRALSKVEAVLNGIRLENEKTIEQFRVQYREQTEQAEQARMKAIQELQDSVNALQSEQGIDPKQIEAALTRLSLKTQTEERREQVKKVALKAARDQDIKRNNDLLELQTRQIQDFFKLLAVCLPPIPPLLLAGFVFFQRRSHESEGVAQSRLR
jgi:ABC-2 type transport system permease protein